MSTTAMNYRPLGRTGVRVSPLCLGTMMFGRGGNEDHDDCVRVIHRALDGGINFVDTADVYGNGESEEIVGKALRARGDRDEVVLATKGHHRMGADANMQGNSRRWLTRAIDDSLRRLGTDYIDLYQIHRPDPLYTDIEETLGVLTDMVRAGKIRYFGTTTFPAHSIVEAQWAARAGHLERFRTEQPPYSILAREAERAVLPVCEAYDLGVLCWSPLAGGWLSGRYRRGQEPEAFRRIERNPNRYDVASSDNARKLEAAIQLGELADGMSLSLIELAISFVLRHRAVTAAIIGPRTMTQLEELLQVREDAATEEALDRIDEIVPPGITLNVADAGWEPPQLRDARLRRR